MRKWLHVSLAIFLLASSLWFLTSRVETRIGERDVALNARNLLEIKAYRTSKVQFSNALSRLQKISRLENLEDFEKKTALLSKGEREAVASLLRTKLFEANFRRADLYLSRAGDLLREDENHPTGSEYIERAKSIYEKMEKLLELGIPEQPGSSLGNARINYLKGVYYFRQLIFIKDPKNEMTRVDEIVGQSAKHLSMVFAHLPKDRDTEVAIEILQKKAKDMGAGEGSPAKTRLDLLPSNDKNRGPMFAIEGMEEGKN